jgi:hypothetical protein
MFMLKQKEVSNKDLSIFIINITCIKRVLSCDGLMGVFYIILFLSFLSVILKVL